MFTVPGVALAFLLAKLPVAVSTASTSPAYLPVKPAEPVARVALSLPS